MRRLSTGENAAGKQRIAFIAGGYANSRQWTKYPSQQSVPIQLLAGQKYCVEAGESHHVVVEGSALSNGLYLIRLVSGNQVSHLKVVLAK